MSNTQVGPVYDTIIAEVINAVRVDFEENGVDDGALEDLKKTWQHKLSQMDLAQFPWDPKPDPPATLAAASGPPTATPVTAASSNYAQTAGQGLSLPGAPNGVPMKQEPGFAPGEPTIKQEPGVQPSLQGYNPALGTAAQRAALALESQYGQRAAASISAIHSGMSQVNPAAPQQPQQGQRPGQQQQVPQHVNPQQQYRQGVAASIQQRMQQVPRPGQNGLPTSQVDGTPDAAEDDTKTIIMDRTEIDAYLHAQLAARGKEMEGGGLMVPLKKVKKSAKARRSAEKRGDAEGVANVDGGLDDDVKSEEDDEDAINSDLDDPDDGADDDEDDDESMGHMMLCMYDKVQRVKNKWKCTLKDGVLTVNGKEYVFMKATGEYEW
ncbi:transcription factor IIA, alpha/beta subunit [Chaetomium sp. MPI-SDFR-AT-0129]|nr:transcription factor IIA, alpha/beta subunit [Chaetomium sp. MPI-SDFR-AT-0129]